MENIKQVQYVVYRAHEVQEDKGTGETGIPLVPLMLLRPQGRYARTGMGTSKGREWNGSEERGSEVIINDARSMAWKHGEVMNKYLQELQNTVRTSHVTSILSSFLPIIYVK
jgi:hypothetical protein